jgi:hypothetical protein
MLNLAGERIDDLAVVECMGRIVRSLAACKLPEGGHVPAPLTNHRA